MTENRRKFLRKVFITTIGTLTFPKFIFASKNEKKEFEVLKPDITKWTKHTLNIAWIGHSTVLINFFGTTILTDPVMLNRIGLKVFGLTFGPGRILPPALTIDELIKPDIIILSHAHFDHTDYPTLKKISTRYPNQIEAVVAKNTKDVISGLQWKNITELDWKESIEICGIKITAIETKHFGWRIPGEKDRARGFMKKGRSFNAYLLEKNGKSVLFGGDTAFTNKYEVIKNKNVDIVIMPIGAYNPWKTVHCNPEEALTMAENIGAKYFVPIHCKTFRLGGEPYNEPIDWLRKSAVNYKLTLALDTIGETFTLNNI